MEFSREIDLRDLPPDMQTLLAQFFEEYFQDSNVELPQKLKLYLAPVIPLWHQIRNEVWDYRGPGHVANFIKSMWRGESISPIIVRGDQFYDGRHRLWAAKTLDIEVLEAIDLNDYFTPKI